MFCICICMYICLCIYFLFIYMYICMYICIRICVSECAYTRIHVLMSDSLAIDIGEDKKERRRKTKESSERRREKQQWWIVQSVPRDEAREKRSERGGETRGESSPPMARYTMDDEKRERRKATERGRGHGRVGLLLIEEHEVALWRLRVRETLPRLFASTTTYRRTSYCVTCSQPATNSLPRGL